MHVVFSEQLESGWLAVPVQRPLFGAGMIWFLISVAILLDKN
jgi:hypothetical protein